MEEIIPLRQGELWGRFLKGGARALPLCALGDGGSLQVRGEVGACPSAPSMA